MKLRHQLPAYSPVSFRSVVAAAPQVFSLGSDPRTQLREMLRVEYGSSDVVLCGSGTQALALAIREALDRNEATTVALPAFSCFDVASAAIGARARATLYDVDPSTLGPDYDSFERVLASGVRVAVIAPLYGLPLDWNAISAIAARHGALLIEDAAQGHGSFWDGKRVGSRGVIATLSFGRGKGWTGGHGGALLRKGAVDSSQASLPRNGVAQDARTMLGLAAQWALGRPSLYGIPQSLPGLQLGETVYHPPREATTLERAAAAAILTTKSDAMAETAVRRSNARVLLAAAREHQVGEQIVTDSLSVPGYLRLPLRMRSGMGSFADRRRARSLGVTGSYPTTLGGLPQLAPKLQGPDSAWPGAQTLAEELVTFPTHSLLTEDDLSELIALMKTAGPAAS